MFAHALHDVPPPPIPVYPEHDGHVDAAPPAFIHAEQESPAPLESLHVDVAVSHQDMDVGGDPGQLPPPPDSFQVGVPVLISHQDVDVGGEPGQLPPTPYPPDVVEQTNMIH